MGEFLISDTLSLDPTYPSNTKLFKSILTYGHGKEENPITHYQFIFEVNDNINTSDSVTMLLTFCFFKFVNGNNVVFFNSCFYLDNNNFLRYTENKTPILNQNVTNTQVYDYKIINNNNDFILNKMISDDETKSFRQKALFFKFYPIYNNNVIINYNVKVVFGSKILNLPNFVTPDNLSFIPDGIKFVVGSVNSKFSSNNSLFYTNFEPNSYNTSTNPIYCVNSINSGKSFNGKVKFASAFPNIGGSKPKGIYFGSPWYKEITKYNVGDVVIVNPRFVNGGFEKQYNMNSLVPGIDCPYYNDIANYATNTSSTNFFEIFSGGTYLMFISKYNYYHDNPTGYHDLFIEQNKWIPINEDYIVIEDNYLDDNGVVSTQKKVYSYYQLMLAHEYRERGKSIYNNVYNNAFNIARNINLNIDSRLDINNQYYYFGNTFRYTNKTIISTVFELTNNQANDSIVNLLGTFYFGKILNNTDCKRINLSNNDIIYDRGNNTPKLYLSYVGGIVIDKNNNLYFNNGWIPVNDPKGINCGLYDYKIDLSKNSTLIGNITRLNKKNLLIIKAYKNSDSNITVKIILNSNIFVINNILSGNIDFINDNLPLYFTFGCPNGNRRLRNNIVATTSKRDNNMPLIIDQKFSIINNNTNDYNTNFNGDIVDIKSIPDNKINPNPTNNQIATFIGNLYNPTLHDEVFYDNNFIFGVLRGIEYTAGTYIVGDVTRFPPNQIGNLYLCRIAHIGTATFDATKWEALDETLYNTVNVNGLFSYDELKARYKVNTTTGITISKIPLNQLISRPTTITNIQNFTNVNELDSNNYISRRYAPF